MEELVSFDQAEKKITQNKIIVNDGKATMVNSRVWFGGRDNILYIEDGACIKNSKISFLGNNSVAYFSASKNAYFMDVSVFNDSVVFIGGNNYFNPAHPLVIIAAEQQNVLIGRDGLFSFGIFMRTTDPHLLYDIRTKRRLNQSKSVFVGDHVWIGQNAQLFKGTCIGSGAIVGGGTVLAGKRIPSNVAVGGNPVKIIRENVFFSSECVNSWTDEMTKKYEAVDSEAYIYHVGQQTMAFERIDSELKHSDTVDCRLKKAQEFLVNNTEKNRFAIKGVKKKRLWAPWKCMTSPSAI